VKASWITLVRSLAWDAPRQHRDDGVYVEHRWTMAGNKKATADMFHALHFGVMPVVRLWKRLNVMSGIKRPWRRSSNYYTPYPSPSKILPSKFFSSSMRSKSAGVRHPKGRTIRRAGTQSPVCSKFSSARPGLTQILITSRPEPHVDGLKQVSRKQSSKCPPFRR